MQGERRGRQTCLIGLCTRLTQTLRFLPRLRRAEICFLARALRIYFPEKPFNPALIRITVCHQTGCECVVCISNPSLMMGLCKASEEAKLAWHSPNKQVCQPLRSHCTNVDYRQVALECLAPCLPAPQFKADIFCYPRDIFA